jgi:hypothetical protein
MDNLVVFDFRNESDIYTLRFIQESTISEIWYEYADESAIVENNRLQTGNNAIPI